MRPKHLMWAISVLVVALVGGAVSGCATGGGQGIVNVNEAKAAELLAAGGVRIVDVRTAAEFEAGHLKWAENVPVDQVATAVASWDRSEPLLVYCASGSRSASAVKELKSMGFKTIYHLSAGLVSWRGDLDTGGGTPVAQAPPVKTGETPVMYEFYTDW